ncbi:MAG: DUF5320 domain-containing protein [Thermoplasmata archaeon]
MSNKCDNMPRGDGTGPDGLGPMTGRALGYCAGYSSPGFTKGIGRGLGRGLARGRGRGIGRGLGRGFRGGRGRAFSPPVDRPVVPYTPRRVPVYSEGYQQEGTSTYSSQYTKEDEIKELKAYAEDLKRELEEVEKRIDEISE